MRVLTTTFVLRVNKLLLTEVKYISLLSDIEVAILTKR